MISKLLRLVRFSTVVTSELKIPIIDIGHYITSPNLPECKSVIDALVKYGCFFISDPRYKKEYHD